MSIGELEKKYGIKIISYGLGDRTYPAFESKMIWYDYSLEVDGDNTYPIFRDATGHYEIDA